ncbi:alcohol dehydrogenase [Tothia fuscella]|uniref:Alcohol dehydrogenase n=1 Tax=Tothia fuscella TaxID=1048955 RepID=A0A9P4NFL9_9PEZI|nr:alcohol dehydrogenase [Tothia fuscella]
MTKTMKAVQWNQVTKNVEINQVPIPVPGKNQILVRIASASLCHSDLMAMGDGYISTSVSRPKPITLGHEGAGWVDTLGPGSEGKGFKKGDAIGFLYIIGCCFECEGCKVHNNHCLRQTSHTQGFTLDGFFAEYALTDWHSAIVLPEELDVKVSAPIFCAGITSFHCVESCELKPGETLAIIGCGGLGQLACQYAKAMGYKVIGIDISGEILAVCKAQGADYVFNSRTDKEYVKGIKELTGGKGVDTVAVFSAASQAYDSAPLIVKLGGVILVAGLPEKGVTFNALAIALGTFKVRGDSTGTPDRMPRAIEFIAKNKIQPEVEIYHSLDDVPAMIEKMKAGKSTKRMVVSMMEA